MRQLTNELKSKLKGKVLGACFSQNKNELVLGFTDAQRNEFYIKASLNSDFSCLYFPDNFTRSKRNNVDLFTALVDLKVDNVVQTANDRSFSIVFQGNDDFQLLFKLHGNRANIVLLINGKVTEIFKNQLDKDWYINLNDLPLTIDSSFEKFDENKGNLKKLYPTLGPLPIDYLKEQDYSNLNLDEKWLLFQELLKVLNEPPTYYITTHKNKLRLSLLPIGHIDHKTDSPTCAINHFFIKFVKDDHLAREKEKLAKTINKKIVQSENYIQKNQLKLDELDEGVSYSQLADIIMANMHQIPPNTKKAVFNNFYTNNPIEINLKQHLSPQKNAEMLYRKAKNQKIEIEKLQKNISDKEDQLISLYENLEKLEAAVDLKDVKKYHKQFSTNNINRQEVDTLPYKAFEIDNFKIWVGKNAKANDEMLRNYSHKEDLWLHAKDVPGSHVLIKWQAGRHVPPSVIERAASLAAYYSKRKTDSLCPVIVTPCKYVRKSKNLLAGQVIVDREEVILVEPTAPQKLT